MPLEDWLQGNRGRPDPAETLKGKRVLAFCGIARPEDFRETLACFDPGYLELVAFEDHCRYTGRRQSDLADRARSTGAVAVTTEKDAVKLDPELIGPRCQVLCLEHRPVDEAAVDRVLDELLETRINSKRR